MKKSTKGLEKLRQTLSDKGILNTHAVRDKSISKFNPKIEQIRNPDTRGAMRELRNTGIAEKELDKEIDIILKKEKEEREKEEKRLQELNKKNDQT